MPDEKSRLEQQITKLEEALAEKNSLLLIYKEEIQRMNEKLSVVLEQIDGELKLANKLHNMLIPTELPKIPGFSFSSKFKASNTPGGDYYEIIHHEDKYKFALLMASSSGYSISALFLSILLRQTSKIATKKGFSPIEFVEKIQEELRDSMREQDSFHLVYAVVDRRKNDITYTSCGNLAFLRWDSRERSVDNLLSEKTPITKDNKLSFSQNKIKFQADDRFMLCSRGVVEQKNRKEHNFGIDSLVRNFHDHIQSGTHELRNELFVDLEKYAQDVEMQQDWTALLMDVDTNLVKLSLK